MKSFISVVEVGEAVNELNGNVKDTIENDDETYRGPLSKGREVGDLRSDEVESQIAISFGKTDIYKEICLLLLAWHGCDAAVYFRLGIRDIEF